MKIGKNLKYLGKYIDQPLVLDKINKAVPPLLIGGSTAYALHDAFNNHKDASNKNLIKNASTLLFTSVFALMGLRGLKIGGKQIIKRFIHVHPKKEIIAKNSKLVDEFLNSNKIDDTIKNLLNKAKTKPLNKKEIIKLEEKLNTSENEKKFFEKLFPPPEDIDSHHAWEHIKRLSYLGALPVIGGVLGGLIGDRIADKNNWRKGIPNKVKEGSYQYLANIFLCNLGAYGAIKGLEVLQNKKIIKPPHPLVKAGVMLTGVMTAGVIGGSFIANIIGQKIINPLLGEKPHKKLYAERVPEALDIALHVDDIATVGVLSGLKWIEPALPLMYAISGYRAGMGYRNHEVKNHFHRGQHKYQKHNREVYFKHLRDNPAFISFNSGSLFTKKQG